MWVSSGSALSYSTSSQIDIKLYWHYFYSDAFKQASSVPLRTGGSAVSCPRSVTTRPGKEKSLVQKKNLKQNEINTKRKEAKEGTEHLALRTEVVIRLCDPGRDKTSRSAWIGFSFQDFTFTRDLETNVLLV